LYRLLRFFYKNQSALTPLLLLFSRDPLALGSRLMMRKVRIWIAQLHKKEGKKSTLVFAMTKSP
jgi:hypothetical protein